MMGLLTALGAIPGRIKLALGLALVLVLMFAAYKYQQARADRAEAALRPARATVKALDKVNTETVAIQADTAEKQRAVDEIEGADTRLPDGFGSSLQRVRDGKRD